MSSVEPRGIILQATCDWVGVWVSKHDTFELRGKVGHGRGEKHTCSPVSSLRASFTFPMLPAPIVLPKIHFPDGVGIVVRDLLVCFEVVGAPGLRGSGPP